MSDLLKDKKELAEHLMLLDLGRNDVGKVSKINTVKVTEKFKVEKYSHVMHIVSNVIGKFNHQTSVFETLLSGCLLYTSPSPRDDPLSRMPSSA